RLLQALLSLETPVYHHHPLITDERGRRLAKRERAATIRDLRETGASAEAVIARIERSSRLARAG
ncbi:MAG: tRNA glutamyl-Q(34) synthetase GluQRS, partial [Proteobacteria bacterium]|nr:tRNA glutamyl-Q(34) synthetase GluQRS [Pseudomonadota bacterium]